MKILVVLTVHEIKLIFGNCKTENDLIAGRSKIISNELVIVSLQMSCNTENYFKEDQNATKLVVQTVHEVKLIFWNRKT